jgi:DNA (cytosine-5)-methyltransferase 1
MALKRLGCKVEIVGISEIDNNVIKSYEAIHGQVKNYGGIGSFDRFPKDIDILTWSFPCQDISLVGKQRGLVDGSRSNYGYVFLDTVKATPIEERPKVLIMENVPALVSKTFQKDYREIHERLENMGYQSYAAILNAKDYGVSQNRERIFVVSILGDYSYTFPERIKLENKLLDYLEDEVDEKYFLSQKMMKYIAADNEKWAGSNNKSIINKEIASAINTGEGSRRVDASNYIAPNLSSNYDLKCVGFLDIKGNNSTLRIRKLTPRECWRLMGISDDDFDKASKVNSNSQLYKQAGNAIVVDVLEAIFREMIR